jgi:hypothetical protein
MRRLQLLLVFVTFAVVCAIPGTAVNAQTNTPSSPAPTSEKSTADLWLDVSLIPPVVDNFNDHARPDDIARVETPRLLPLLSEVPVGRRLLIFKTIEDAELFVPRLQNDIDIIGYNLEHGPANSPEEQADPLGSIRRMRELADEYGMELAVGPDHSLALEAGAIMAPYVDIFVLQVQRVQTDPFTVREFVLPMAQQLRQANPDIQISVQLRTDGDPDQLTALIDSMKYELDGVSILTSLDTVAGAEALIHELRNPPPPTPLPTTVSNPAEPVVATMAPAPMAQSGPPSPGMPGPIGGPSAPTNPLLLAAGAFMAGVFFSGFVITGLYYLYRHLRS